MKKNVLDTHVPYDTKQKSKQEIRPCDLRLSRWSE